MMNEKASKRRLSAQDRKSLNKYIETYMEYSYTGREDVSLKLCTNINELNKENKIKTIRNAMI